jgi:hypothetical protein
MRWSTVLSLPFQLVFPDWLKQGYGMDKTFVEFSTLEVAMLMLCTHIGIKQNNLA